jgi:hypothetical protein
MGTVDRLRVQYKHAVSNRLYAYVDSGSSTCLFHIALAELVGLDVTKNPIVVEDLKGVIRGESDPCYYHKVTLLLDIGHRLDVVAGFAKKLNTQAIVGRKGFFDTFRVKFDQSTMPPCLELDKIELTQ